MKKDFVVSLCALLVGTSVFSCEAVADTIVSVTQFKYDAADRLECSAVRMNAAVFSTLPASACSLGTTGSQGADRIIRSIYDEAGRVVQVLEAYGTPAQRAYSTLAYSSNGKVTDSIDANGNRTKMTYDGFDRLNGRYYPSTTRPAAFNSSSQATALATAGTQSSTDYEIFSYNNNNSQTSWRRRSGQVINYEYDNLNREIRQYNSGGLVPELHTGYNLTNATTYKRFGSSSGAGVTYAYDGLGRLSSATDINGRSVSYQYNQASIRTRLTHPDGNWQPYTFDALNRLTWTGMGAANLTISFNSLSQVTGLTRGNGTSTSATYDGVGRLQTYGHNLAGTSYDASWVFAYNPASQIRTINTAAAIYDYREGQSNTNARTYDGLNRDAGIAGIGGYDNQGNLTSDGTRVMTYDLYNRLKTVIGNGANLTLTYDTEGRLSSYSNNGVVTQFLYDGVRLIAEYNGSGQITKRYVHGTGSDQPFVQFNGSDPNNASLVRYLYTNYQGSVIATADSNGYKSEIYKYGAYGEPKNGFNQTSFSGESRFRYTGQTVLPDAGLYYYKARVYDPTMGRFMQTDPIGADDDLNLYAYVGGDPINRMDPTGLYKCQGSTQQCSDLEVDLQRLRDALKRKDITSEQRQVIQRVVDAYGAAGHDNKVDVKFGSLEGDTQGTTTYDGKTKRTEVVLEFDIYSRGVRGRGGQQKSFVERAEVLVHEGIHTRNRQEYGDFKRGLDGKPFRTDLHADERTAYLGQRELLRMHGQDRSDKWVRDGTRASELSYCGTGPSKCSGKN